MFMGDTMWSDVYGSLNLPPLQFNHVLNDTNTSPSRSQMFMVDHFGSAAITSPISTGKIQPTVYSHQPSSNHQIDQSRALNSRSFVGLPPMYQQGLDFSFSHHVPPTSGFEVKYPQPTIQNNDVSFSHHVPPTSGFEVKYPQPTISNNGLNSNTQTQSTFHNQQNNVDQFNLVNNDVLFLHRKLEELTQQNQLLFNQVNNQRNNRNRGFHPSEIEQILPEFNPDNKNGISVIQWTEKLRNLKIQHEWTDYEATFYGTTRLRGPAQTYINSICEINPNNFEQFCCEIKQQFNRSHNEMDVFRRMKNRVKNVTIVADCPQKYPYRGSSNGQLHG